MKIVSKEKIRKMSDYNNEKAIRILTFSGKKDDWMMWSDKFMAKAMMKGYDEVLGGTIIVPEDKTTNLSASQGVTELVQ